MNTDAPQGPWPFPDPDLGTKEELFKRYKKEHWANGTFSGLGLSFATHPSFNRSKFSSAKDVLVDGDKVYEGWGVLACIVEDVQEKVLSGEGVEYAFFPVHDPKRHNYAHSIVKHAPSPEREPTKLVKKKFRTRLGQRMRQVVPSAV